MGRQQSSLQSSGRGLVPGSALRVCRHRAQFAEKGPVGPSRIPAPVQSSVAAGLPTSILKGGNDMIEEITASQVEEPIAAPGLSHNHSSVQVPFDWA